MSDFRKRVKAMKKIKDDTELELEMRELLIDLVLHLREFGDRSPTELRAKLKSLNAHWRDACIASERPIADDPNEVSMFSPDLFAGCLLWTCEDKTDAIQVFKFIGLPWTESAIEMAQRWMLDNWEDELNSHNLVMGQNAMDVRGKFA